MANETPKPMMIVLARESRGYTQSALASEIGVTQGTLSKVENGQAPPAGDLVRRLSESLNYPASFFFQEYAFRSLPISFYRKRIRVKAVLEKTIRARLNICRLHAIVLLRSVDLPELQVPVINLKEYRGNVEQVAREMRLRWHTPPGPIVNLTSLLESMGLLIVPCDLGTNQIDAISSYSPGDGCPPIILMNASTPGDRQRFSLTHELAHLLFHHHLALPGNEIEDEANRFAAEFLLPAAEVRNYLDRPTLAKLANLKPYWKVSIQSLLMRASQLQKITERQERYLWAQIGKAGYRTCEPFPIPREPATLITELIQSHAEHLGYSERDLAALLHLHLPEFRGLYGSGGPTVGTLRPVRQPYQA